MLSNGEEISDMLIVNKDRLFLGKGIYTYFSCLFTFFSVFLCLLFSENLGAVRELSKVTGHLGHRVEDLERANETVTVCLHF